MERFIRAVTIGLVGSVLVPIVVNVGANTVALVADGIAKLKYNHKIKKGLKKGTIVEIDGQYFEVQIVEEA